MNLIILVAALAALSPLANAQGSAARHAADAAKKVFARPQVAAPIGRHLIQPKSDNDTKVVSNQPDPRFESLLRRTEDCKKFGNTSPLCQLAREQESNLPTVKKDSAAWPVPEREYPSSKWKDASDDLTDSFPTIKGRIEQSSDKIGN